MLHNSAGGKGGSGSHLILQVIQQLNGLLISIIIDFLLLMSTICLSSSCGDSIPQSDFIFICENERSTNTVGGAQTWAHSRR